MSATLRMYSRKVCPKVHAIIPTFKRYCVSPLSLTAGFSPRRSEQLQTLFLSGMVWQHKLVLFDYTLTFREVTFHPRLHTVKVPLCKEHHPELHQEMSIQVLTLLHPVHRYKSVIESAWSKVLLRKRTRSANFPGVDKESTRVNSFYFFL